MIRKGFIVAAIISLMLAISANSFAADENWLAIQMGNTKIETPAYIDDGNNIYLPLRAIVEVLGFRVQWSEEDGMVSVFRPEGNIILDVKKNKIAVNNHDYYTDSTNVQNRTYLRDDLFYEFFGLKTQLDRENRKVNLESVNKNIISLNTVQEVYENTKIKMTIQYPQIDGLKDKTVQENINSTFKKYAKDAENEGLQNADELAKYNAEYTGSPNKCETYFDYVIKYNQNELLSVVFLNYQYTGGAHGITVLSSLNINLETGEDYRLKDLFKSGDYIPFLNSTIRDEIDKRVEAGRLSEFTDSPFKTIKEVSDFYLSDSSVVIYFQQYEYFPYAAGIQEFPINFVQLKTMLSPKFSFLYDSNKLLKANSAINSMNVGDIGCVILKGNPTTGYTWHYIIEDNDIVKLESQKITSDSNLLGAESTFSWNYKALRAGQTKIIFKYYRDWEGEESVTKDGIREFLISINA